jgi:hypothetical protein
MRITATAILLIALPAVAQPKKLREQANKSATRLHVMDTVNESSTGWTFKVLTARPQARLVDGHTRPLWSVHQQGGMRDRASQKGQ